jgi:hypothetical protein
MSNKDEFDRIAAMVLQRLDEKFPVALRLDATGIIDESDEEAVKVFYYTVLFLEKEGLLTYEDASDIGTRFVEVMLTGKGLAVLNAVPDVIKEKTTFRQKIKTGLKSGSKEILKTAMNQLVQAVVKGDFTLPGLNPPS